MSNSNTLPILDHFLFELAPGELVMTASDLETTMSSKMEVRTEDTGAIAVPARMLLDILKAFPDIPLTIKVDPSTYAVELTSDAGKYKLTQIETAQEAYESCLKQSGCSLVRDAVDERLIESIRNNTGKVIDSQDEVAGWDRYPSIVRPPDFDTDRDGMPDEWERTSGLDPDDPSDGNQDRNDDGFTNLEDYLNSKCSE